MGGCLASPREGGLKSANVAREACEQQFRISSEAIVARELARQHEPSATSHVREKNFSKIFFEKNFFFKKKFLSIFFGFKIVNTGVY